MSDAKPRRVEISRRTFQAFAALMIAAVVAQVFLAGAMLLSDASYVPLHQNVGHLLILLPIIPLVLAFVGRAPPAVKWMTGAVLVAGQLQYLFIGLRPSVAAALHPANALLMFWLDIELVRRSGVASGWGAPKKAKAGVAGEDSPVDA